MDTLLSKSKSSSLKFISVLLMIFYHAFGFTSRIKYSYISLFKVKGTPIEQYIASVGEICVGMFLFLSGYGLYKSYSRGIGYRGIFKRIWNFYKKFWLMFLLFIPLGFYLGVYRFQFKEFLMNFFGFRSTYNKEWWFVRLYLELLLIYPLVIKIINKFNYKIILTVSFVVNLIGYGIPKVQSMLGLNSILIYEFSIFLGGQFIFVLGIVIARYGLFTKLSGRINWSRGAFILLSILTFVIVIIVGNIPVLGEAAKLLLIPVFIFMLAESIKEDSWLSRLGVHSTNIWLIHSFFCYYYFQRFTFALKYSVLIFLQLVVVTVLISIVINRIGAIRFKSKLITSDEYNSNRV